MMQWQQWLNDWFAGDAAGAQGGDRSPNDGAPKEHSKAELFVAARNFAADGRLGGFGAVYRATFPGGSEAAVKVINVGDAAGGGPPAGLASEVATLGRLQHPNLARLQGWGHGQGQTFLVYELLSGGDAAGWLQGAPEQFGWAERLWLALDAACGLQHMHAKAVPHRGVRCSNVLMHPAGAAKLGDFRLACARGQGGCDDELASALLVAVPAHARGARMSHDDCEADVHAFGILMLELLLNQRPAKRGHDGQVAYPIFSALQPLDEAAEERAAAFADASAAWPVELSKGAGRLALSAASRAAVVTNAARPAALQEVVDGLRGWAAQFCEGKRRPNWCAGGPTPPRPQQRGGALTATLQKPGAAGDPGSPPLDLPLAARSHAAAPAGLPAAWSGAPARPAAEPSAMAFVCVEAFGHTVATLPTDTRTLVVDAGSPMLGRKHQRGFFEKLLGSGEGKRFVACVSRSHLKVVAGQADGSLEVTNLSMNPVIVAGHRVDQGSCGVATPGDIVDFIAAGSQDDAEAPVGEQVTYLSFRVERVSGPAPLAAPSGKVIESSLAKASGSAAAFGAGAPEPEAGGAEGVMAPFWLMLSGTAVKEDLEAGRRRVKSDAGGLTVGRAHQTALLADAVTHDVVQYISRDHFKIERHPETGAWRLRSLTGNPIWHVRSGERTTLSKESPPVALACGDSVLLFTGASDRTPDGPGSLGSLRWIFRAAAAEQRLETSLPPSMAGA